MFYADELGLPSVRQRIRTDFDYSREPASLLVELAEGGKSFKGHDRNNASGVSPALLLIL